MDRPATLRDFRPWGFFDSFAFEGACCVKILTCLPGAALSLQKHRLRDELWVALDGGAMVELDGETLRPARGQELWLPRGSVHRLLCDGSNPGPVRVLEISYGCFDENDIERLEDVYGRS